jgi:hypothetical protein
MAAGVRDWRTDRIRADNASWAACILVGSATPLVRINETRRRVNPTRKAIVWYDADPEDDDEAAVRVIIYCFKPLDTYSTISRSDLRTDNGGRMTAASMRR